jgi:hypothetical protein
LKVECDDWYGRNLDAEQRDDGLREQYDTIKGYIGSSINNKGLHREQYNTIKVYIGSSVIC